ncbi:MAG: hypothetical protein JW866_09925, partial [Ignavibacteriales bacterium]|nr:hypothetical protein [Ignavibacteriales bacterium]
MTNNNSKILFLIWRFNDHVSQDWDTYNCIVKYKEFNVSNNENNKFIAIKLPNEEKGNEIFATIIELVNSKKSPNDNLVLCHDKPSQIQDAAKELKYILFEGNSISHTVLYTKLLVGSTFNPDAFSEHLEELKTDIFNDIWNEYTKKKVFEEAKVNLINLWLPFAIDIQGLSEVEEIKRNDYLKEIYADLDKDNYVK